MKIMVFLHGTVLMHKSASGVDRSERVRQVVDRERSVFDFSGYIPVESAQQKLRNWNAKGAEISYLSFHKTVENVEKDKAVLGKYDFPEGEIYFRQRGERYEEIVEQTLPEILVEDDCESIGGEQEMVYPHLKPGVREGIISIVVQEFGGIDHLPDEINELLDY